MPLRLRRHLLCQIGTVSLRNSTLCQKQSNNQQDDRMNYNFSFFSYLLCALVFLAFTIFALHGWSQRSSGRALVLASLMSTLWSAAIASQTQWAFPSFSIRFSLEILRNFCWCLFLLRIIGVNKTHFKPSTDKARFFLIAALLVLTIVPIVNHLVFPLSHIDNAYIFTSQGLLIWQISYAILMLMLVEQVLRNTRSENRWQIKFICLAVGVIAGFDFFFYSEALLFRRLSDALWDARGLINAITVPFFIIGSRRNRQTPMYLNLSRDFTFHGTLFLATGFYLIVMALAAWYIRVLGGTWNNAVQIFFLSAGILLLIVLVFSGSLRAKLRVLLSQYFFSYKYDYRKEWLRITDALTGTQKERPLPERAIYALANIVDSRGGALWTVGHNNHFYFRLSTDGATPSVIELNQNEPLIKFLIKRSWVIDINELNKDPDLYGGLTLPTCLLENGQSWLITPLLLHDNLFGFIVLHQPTIRSKLNWEDHDIIKVAGRQAASALSQLEASSALANARQFEAFNQMSAFIVHDIKTLVSQLSLMVKNAEKHKSNPAFINDMIQTTEHSVQKMTRLLKQLSESRLNSNSDVHTHIELNRLLLQLSENRKNMLPPPVFLPIPEYIYIDAEAEKLSNVLSHLIQNAQEACTEQGAVSLQLAKQHNSAIITITDTGCGMSKDFLENELFQPFRSTKGVSGMGIGVFQCQQYIISLGGTVRANSTLGHGSSFTLTLPITENKPIHSR